MSGGGMRKVVSKKALVALVAFAMAALTFAAVAYAAVPQGELSGVLQWHPAR